MSKSNLLEQIKSAAHEVFTIKKESKAIRVTHNGAFCSTSQGRSPNAYSLTIYLSENDIVEYVRYLLDNLYILFFDSIFRQIVGVPWVRSAAQI